MQIIYKLYIIEEEVVSLAISEPCHLSEVKVAEFTGDYQIWRI